MTVDRHEFYLSLCIAILSAVAMVLAVPAFAETPAAAIQKDISYGPKALEKLDLCIPADKASVTTAVIAIHGGGLFAGDKGMLTARMCAWFNPSGIMVASVDYRLVDGKPENAWPASLTDVQLAVRWLRAHQTEYGIKLKTICAIGASSGGHLSLFLEDLLHPVASDVAGLFPEQSPSVDCVVDQWGPVDYTDPSPVMKKTLSLAFPGEAAGNTANARSISPYFSLRKGMGNVLIFQGLSDPAVPPRQSTKLLHALQAGGVGAKLITFEGQHGMPSDEWDKYGMTYAVPFVLENARNR